MQEVMLEEYPLLEDIPPKGSQHEEKNTRVVTPEDLPNPRKKVGVGKIIVILLLGILRGLGA